MTLREMTRDTEIHLAVSLTVLEKVKTKKMLFWEFSLLFLNNYPKDYELILKVIRDFREGQIVYNQKATDVVDLLRTTSLISSIFALSVSQLRYCIRRLIRLSTLCICSCRTL